MRQERRTATEIVLEGYILDRLHEMVIATYLPGSFEASFLSNEPEFSNILAAVLSKPLSFSQVLLGAQYDTFGGLPGTDGNAAAMAVLPEAADWIRVDPIERSVIFGPVP